MTTPVPAEPGDTVRVRIINTDNGSMPVWATVPYRVLAIDGGDLNEPTPVDGKRLTIPAGGRADLEVTVPDVRRGARAGGGRHGLRHRAGRRGRNRRSRRSRSAELDLMSYGTPAEADLDVDDPDRSFDYDDRPAARLPRRPARASGGPSTATSTPTCRCSRSARATSCCSTSRTTAARSHPMHLHGHHAVVIARNAEPATGSPVWVDSIDVEDGESVDLAFKADNPGIWMDHCHNLPHAAEGLVAHLMYEGVSTPFTSAATRPTSRNEWR